MVHLRYEDNGYRGAWRSRGITIGYVDEVNGPGAQEIPDFISTRYELIQLVKYWVGEAVRIRWFEFFSGSTGSREIRVRPFAWYRVAHIGRLLGEDRIDAAVDEVYDQFRKECDERLWDIYMNGDRAQWDRVESEFYQQLGSGSQEPLDTDSGSSINDSRIPTIERVRHLDGVIGWEAEAVPEFVPTRHELIRVANYWANRKLEVGRRFFDKGETHDTELRLVNFAEARIAHIADLLGDADLNTAIEEVFSQSEDNQKKELWQIYVEYFNARLLAARRNGPRF